MNRKVCHISGFKGIKSVFVYLLVAFPGSQEQQSQNDDIIK